MNDDRFLPIISPHISSILRVATALAGPAEAEDVVQEALTRAWQSRHTLRDERAARAWLLRITINTARNLQRTLRGSNFPMHGARDDHHDVMMDAIPTQRPLESDPGDRAATLDLRDAVSQLPEDLRLVIALRYYAGLDSTEIGQLISVSPATIRTRLRRALTLLRARLGDRQMSLREEETHAQPQ